MTEWHRYLLGLIAASVYAVLIIMKFLEADKAGTGGWKLGWKAIRFDVIRLFTDGILLAGFLISPLCPAWFGLFSETALGWCTGCIVLISMTLLISVFVDWIPVRGSCREADNKPPSFLRFLLRQFVHIVRIEFALSLVWTVFLLLEPAKTSLLVRFAVAAAVLLLFRAMLRVVRRLGNKAAKTEKEE